MDDLRAGCAASQPSDVSSGAASMDSPETIYVNVREPSGPPAGVLLYYAVLAYPRRNDWQKRLAFVDSMIAMRFREFVVQGAQARRYTPCFRRIKREKVLCGINLGWKRVQRRIDAAIMGWCICLNGRSYRYDAPTPEGKIRLFLRGPKTVNEVIRTYLANRCSSSDAINLEEGSAAANIAHRVWAESFPVLHIAMMNPITVKIVEDQVNFGPTNRKADCQETCSTQFMSPRGFLKPWRTPRDSNAPCVNVLESDGGEPRDFGFKPETAIRLLPTEDPSIAFRFPKQSRF